MDEFAEWVRSLDLQVLTDELKEEIIEQAGALLEDKNNGLL